MSENLGCRTDACLEAAALLLELVVSKRGQESQRPGAEGAGPSQPPETAGGDWLLEEYVQAGSPGETAPEGLLSAAQACSTVTALLVGAVAVPREALLKISPVLLARLFQQLGAGALPPQPTAEVRIVPFGSRFGEEFGLPETCGSQLGLRPVCGRLRRGRWCSTGRGDGGTSA